MDDYAFYILSLISLYEATLENAYLEKAKRFCHKTITNFYDEQNKGFYLYSKENEQLIFTPKETYDGAIPSGNSVMAYVLVKLFHLLKETNFIDIAEKQLTFLSAYAKKYPAGYCFYLLALSIYLSPPENVVAVVKDPLDLKKIKDEISLDTILTVLNEPADGYQLLNNKTTFYVCKNQHCLPPSNEIL
ncbi:hypothetical protein SDC9_154796 [bioreactor metagenome]|uniref:Thioredoxin domain-containing protein n=1 Tax=bioreactor metagenome TaxID=1076179 RepID=A0A645F1I6_9ZZZZ